MSNTVEIVVEGKNEATKVFLDVEKSAVDSAKKSEQAWTKAGDSIESSIQRGGFGAHAAGEGFDKLGTSAKASGTEVEKLGQRSQESGDRLHRIGEASDEVDTKAMGFRDTVTGVSDTLKGLSDSSLTTEQRLFTLGAGIGDLGSAGYNFLVPMFKKAKDALGGFEGGIPGLVSKMGGLKSILVNVGLAAAGMVAVTAAAHALADPVIPTNVQNLTDSLNRFYATGKITGEGATQLGSNLQDLKDSLQIAASRGFDGAMESVTDFVGGLVGVDSRLDDAKQRLQGLDAALTQVAKSSPQRAQEMFGELTTKAGFTKDQIEALKNHLPGYTAAMDAAGLSTGKAAQDTKTLSDSLSEYLTNLQAATDPVFSLVHSLDGVTTAQKAYTDAVKSHGKESQEAKDASFGLAEALSKAEGAALDGSLSYDAFSATLNHWVSAGVLTAQQADAIRSRVDQAKGSADRFQGNYNANLFAADYASPAIEAVRRKLTELHDREVKLTVTTFYGTVGKGSSLTGVPVARAAGGPIGAAASGGVRSGLTWVGERGPELVKLPTGSFVSPAGQSSAHGGAAAASAPEIKVSIDLSGGDRLFMEWLRSRIKTDGGGDVQTALGQ